LNIVDTNCFNLSSSYIKRESIIDHDFGALIGLGLCFSYSVSFGP